MCLWCKECDMCWNRIGLAKFKVKNGANPEKKENKWQCGCDISDSADQRQKYKSKCQTRIYILAVCPYNVCDVLPCELNMALDHACWKI